MMKHFALLYGLNQYWESAYWESICSLGATNNIFVSLVLLSESTLLIYFFCVSLVLLSDSTLNLVMEFVKILSVSG